MSDSLTERQLRAKLPVSCAMTAEEIRAIDRARALTNESRAEFIRRAAMSAASSVQEAA